MARRAMVGAVTDQPATSAVERRNLADADLTRAVEASFENTPNQRLREVMQSLVRHLHAFAGEVELTEEEWFAAIHFLTRTGHITDDKRQEFVLASDVMGLSMLVIGINHRHPSGATESTGFGTSSTPTSTSRAAAGTCSPTTKGVTGSGPCIPWPIRSRPTGRWASCWRPRSAARCAPPTSTSWSPRPATRR
jgi:hypothetical protein